MTAPAHVFSRTRWLAISALILYATVCPAPTRAADLPLAIGRQGDRLQVTFNGTLQWSDSLTGPWLPLTNAISPLTLEPTGERGFYRLVSVFSDDSVVELVLTGPLQEFFDRAFAGIPDGIFPPVREKPYFEATLRLGDLTIPIKLRVRGNSNLQECPFPKLKFKVSPETRQGTPFYDAREVKIGTHCAEGGHGTIGRLRDERAAFREALVYETMGLLGFISPRVRRAHIGYRDTSPTNNVSSGGWQINRHALLLDDIEVVAERLGARLLTEEEKAVLNKPALDEQIVIQLQLFHALVGNWDYALSPGKEGLRNTDVLELANGQLKPVAGDFDLSSWVTGEVRLIAPRDYHPELPAVERQALYNLEQIRNRVGAPKLLQASARFILQRSALEAQIRSAELDDLGRTNALEHVGAFFAALRTETAPAVFGPSPERSGVASGVK